MSFYDKYVCIHPNGKRYYTSDLREFCLANRLDYSAMVNVANGYWKEHKGWRCYHYGDASIIKELEKR